MSKLGMYIIDQIVWAGSSFDIRVQYEQFGDLE